MTLTRRRLRCAVALGVAVGWLATGCDGNGASQASPAVTRTNPFATSSSAPATVSPSSTSTPDPATQAVLAAYTGMWADMAEAARTADYQSPLLAEHAAGAALSTLVRGLYAYRQEGLVIQGRPVTHPQLSALTSAGSPTQASITDCFDDTGWLVYRATGGLADNTPGGHRHVTATVQNASGVWKVTELSTGAEGSC